MKALYGLVFLTLLFGFSWGRDIQRIPFPLGKQKESVLEEAADVKAEKHVEPTVFQVNLTEKNSSSQGVVPEDVPCVDTSYSCGFWAVTGECTKNPVWMLKNCCVWCNHMKTLKNIASNSCTDKHASCKDWANWGECCKNPAYMLEKCCASCEVKGYTAL